MKNYYKMQDARPAQLRVDGWLRDFLEKEVSGMPGNLHKIGYPFNRACWRSRSMTDGGYAQWWPYEQSAYWIDSVVRAASVLDDPKALDAVREQIELSVADDGEPFMGPRELKAAGGTNRWPHAVYFRALWMLFLYTGEEKYIRRIREHYLCDGDTYGAEREVANAEIMYRVAEYYNDETLYAKANRAIASYDRHNLPTTPHMARSDNMMHVHGVTVNEDVKMGAVSYLYTGRRKYLQGTVNYYEKLNSFYMLPDGVHTSYEKITGNESFKVHESCDITDYTYGLAFLMKATGDGKYADRIERAILNALPGAVGPDFRTIQYLSCVNQVICTANSTHIPMWENTPRMAYQPHHYPECCIANIGRAMPNYCLNLYGDTATGLAISLYGESAFAGKYISVKTETAYPFEDTLRFTVTEADEKHNTLALRIPGWSRGYELTVNGKSRYYEVNNGYIRLHVHAGDRLVLKFSFALQSAHTSDGGIYFTYGPLLMTLKLTENWEIDRREPRQTRDFPAYSLTTQDPFAYAVSGYECGEATIVHHPVGKSPFWADRYPIEITIPAKRLTDWTYTVKANKEELADLTKGGEGIDEKQLECGATQVSGQLTLTPRLPSTEFVESHLGEDTTVTLVPYGCTNLRLTVFPKFDFEL